MPEINEEQLPYDYPAIRKAFRQGKLTSEEIAVLEKAGFEFEIVKRRVMCVETGQVFESISAAAKWIERNTAGIQKSLKQGTLAGGYHWWYADEPMPPDSFFKKALKRPVVCVETGQRFESAIGAAGWAGLTSSTPILGAIKDGTLSGGYHWWWADEQLPHEEYFKEKYTGKPVVCVETGQKFESLTKAARWAEMSDASIHHAIREGGITGGYHWWYADEPMPPDNFFKEAICLHSRTVVCVETGQKFESLAAAARWIGTSHAGIGQAIRTGGITGGYHWWYADEPMPPEGYFNKPKERPVVCVETGQRFESIAAAARWAGISHSNMPASIKRGGTCGGYHWEYVQPNKTKEQ